MREDIERFVKIKRDLEVKIAQKIFKDCVSGFTDIVDCDVGTANDVWFDFVIKTNAELNEQEIQNIVDLGFRFRWKSLEDMEYCFVMDRCF